MSTNRPRASLLKQAAAVLVGVLVMLAWGVTHQSPGHSRRPKTATSSDGGVEIAPGSGGGAVQVGNSNNSSGSDNGSGSDEGGGDSGGGDGGGGDGGGGDGGGD